jgi:gliding motility-associated-like protein
MELWVNPDASTPITFPTGRYANTFGGQRYAINPTYGFSAWGTMSDAGAGISVGSNGITVFESGFNLGRDAARYVGAISGWTHVAVVYTAGIPRLYLNGVLVFTGTINGYGFVIHPTIDNVGGVGGGWYKGSVDEYRVWNFPKTAAQILADMNKEMTGSESGLVMHANFNEGSGSKVYTSSTSPYIFSGSPSWLATDAINDYTITNSINGTANASGSYPAGNTTITWTITDKSGNATTCPQIVTINDNQNPTISCASSVTMPVPAGQCAVNVTVPIPVTGDNCSVASVVNSFNGTANASGSYPVGTTNVLWTVKDAAGNTATCTTVVTVTDAFIPTATATDVTVNAVAGACVANATVKLSSVNDNCSSLTIVNDVNGTNDASGNYPLGTTTVTWTVTDPGGNSIKVYQKVTVNDVTPPAILSGVPDVTVPAATGACSANVTVAKPVIAEPCTGSALRFDGVDDFVSFPQSTGAVNNFTVEAWVRPTTTINLPAEAASGVTGQFNQRYIIYPFLGEFVFGAGNLAFGLSAGTNGIVVTAHGNSTMTPLLVSPVTINTWTHVAIVVINKTPNLYINGVFVKTGLQCGPNLHAEIGFGGASPWHGRYGIGGASTGISLGDTYGRFQGDIDDVRIWNVSRTAAQVSANYNHELVGNEANLVSYVTFDEGAGTFAGNQVTVGGPLKSVGFNTTLPQWITPDPVQDYILTNSFNGTDDASGVYTVGSTTVTWTVTDRFGNSSTTSNKVIVNDTQLPVITVAATAAGIASTGSCSANIPIPAPVVSDNCSILSVVNDFNGSNDASGVYPVGITKVTWTVTDVNGNKATAITNVTVADKEGPVITANDITVSTDVASCTAGVVVPVTVTDNCSAPVNVTNSFNGSADPSGNYPIGVTNVTITATDVAGNQSQKVIQITVVDNESPVITCPANITVSISTGTCTANVTVPTPVVSDNCGSVTITNNFNNSANASGVYNLGTTTVIWTAKDAAGNITSCSMTVTVKNTDLPTITCPANIIVNAAPGQCNANVTVPVPTATDNCGVGSIVNDFNNSADASGTYPVGTTTVKWTVTNNQGNTNTCTMTVTVNDTQFPVVTPLADVTVAAATNNCSVFVNLPAPTASDNCSVVSLTNNFNNTGNASGTYPVGTTTVIWSAKDAAGNIGTTSMKVIVNDTQFPVVTTPAVMPPVFADAGQCTAVVSVPALVVNDNCGIASIVNDHNGTADASGTYNIGTTTVNWVVTDLNGNVSTTSQSITVQDTQAPIVTKPADIVVSASPAACTATVNIPSLVASDNCGAVNIVNSKNSTANASDVYPVGTTTVHWTITDNSGNVTTTSMDVTVVDQEVPQITGTPASNAWGYTDAGQCTGTVSSPILKITATDNCGIQSIVNDYNGTDDASGIYPVGTTIVNFTITDIHGNKTPWTVIVEISDIEQPAISAPATASGVAATGQCNGFVSIAKPVVSDNCTVDKVINDFNNTDDASGIYPVGVTTVTWTVTDASGNSRNAYTTVMVADNQMPSITSPASFTVNADAGTCSANVTIPPLSAADNCGVASISNDFNGLSDASGVYPVGLTVIHWTVKDVNGNVNYATQNITVEDHEQPSIVQPSDVTFISSATNCQDYVNVPPLSVSDNCGIWTIVNDYNNTSDASGTYPVGTTKVTWTVTDLHGNVRKAIMNVTVRDGVAPTITCGSNIIVQSSTTDCFAQVNVPAPVVSDNCGIKSIVNNFNGTADASGQYPVGTTTVIWTVTDNGGNTNYCQIDVVVEDKTKPTIVQIADITSCSPVVVIPSIDAKDACGIASVVNDFNNTADASGTYPSGTTTVTYTVTDIHGNSNKMLFNVNIVPNTEVANAGQDQVVCGSEAILSGNVLTKGTGTWSLVSGNGSFDDIHNAMTNVSQIKAGANVYQWTVDYLGCKTSDQVTVSSRAVTLVAEADKPVITAGETVVLKAKASEAGTYSWERADQVKIQDTASVVAQPVFTTTYIVSFTSKSSNCTVEQDVTVQVEKGLLIYNGLTLNGDGQNDKWVIKGLEYYNAVDVYVYNRNGDLVYEGKGYNNNEVSFNGMGNRGIYLGSRELPTGTYFYLVRKNDGTKDLTGFLELMR